MTAQNIAPNLQDPVLRGQESEMTIEQRWQSLFLVERIPYSLFGQNSQPKRP